MRSSLAALALAAACGGSGAQLTPEQIGVKTFEALKANNFTGYYTGTVVTPAQLQSTCPNLAGQQAYFESGDGSERAQDDRFVECRSRIDFAQALLTRVSVRQLPRAAALAPPRCVLPLERAEADVEVNVAGTPHYFSVGELVQFLGGWRVYGKIKNCGTTPPA